MRVKNQLFASLIVACVLTLASGHAQIGKNLIINNFHFNPAKLENHLVISDVDGISQNLRIVITDEAGKVVFEKYETLKAFGKLNYNPFVHVNTFNHGYNTNPNFRGTIRVTAQEGQVAGQYWEMSKDKGSAWNNIAVPAADAVGYDKLVCQHFVSDKGIDAAIVIANAETERETKIDIKLFSDQGGLISSGNYTVPKNGVLRLDPWKLTKSQQTTGTAYITVVGAGKVTGEYWQASPNEKYRIALPLEGVTKVR